ncbi:DUF3761 domain-containing protein [Streptomyces griseochromogenes]|uniref:DUF3761 domain-containing protein n=1 Tax=Streptomyces griseochromogenes TaxID=68214 RepID=UPI001F33E17E|nr:DUF3761 domain-containing protein [Streptomyces griseochromogenes]
MPQDRFAGFGAERATPLGGGGSSAGNAATALCNDGAYSYAAHHQGACSHHGAWPSSTGRPVGGDELPDRRYWPVRRGLRCQHFRKGPDDRPCRFASLGLSYAGPSG